MFEEFHDTANLSTEELEAWRDNDASRSVGQKQDGEESIGQASGR